MYSITAGRPIVMNPWKNHCNLGATVADFGNVQLVVEIEMEIEAPDGGIEMVRTRWIDLLERR